MSEHFIFAFPRKNQSLYHIENGRTPRFGIVRRLAPQRPIIGLPERYYTLLCHFLRDRKVARS
jgi:hypothetical protein